MSFEEKSTQGISLQRRGGRIYCACTECTARSVGIISWSRSIYFLNTYADGKFSTQRTSEIFALNYNHQPQVVGRPGGQKLFSNFSFCFSRLPHWTSWKKSGVFYVQKFFSTKGSHKSRTSSDVLKIHSD